MRFFIILFSWKGGSYPKRQWFVSVRSHHRKPLKNQWFFFFLLVFLWPKRVLFCLFYSVSVPYFALKHLCCYSAQRILCRKTKNQPLDRLFQAVVNHFSRSRQAVSDVARAPEIEAGVSPNNRCTYPSICVSLSMPLSGNVSVNFGMQVSGASARAASKAETSRKERRSTAGSFPFSYAEQLPFEPFSKPFKVKG